MYLEDINENTDLFKEAELSRAIRYFETAKKKSITSSKTRIKEKKRKKFGMKFISSVLLTSLLLSGIKEGKKLYNRILYNLKVKESLTELEERAKQRLVEENLATIDNSGHITILDNTIGDYNRLDLTHASFLETHIYHNVLKEEFNDAIQSASYNNCVYYYTGTTQWFTINGLIDQDGIPSKKEERKKAESLLYEAYENYDGIIRTAEDINKGLGRG